ncbi:MAG: NADH-quinone oxidoreductase subunit H [Spirochaetales bacterium]|nr:NADH-quinone oxidoreductase subunit H [Spirochaetales bacterium]
MEILRGVFYFTVFPGFLFLSITGLFFSWIERKITARLQWRKGPPLLQPFYDFIKLLGKDIMIPKSGNPALFVTAPLLGLVAITLGSTMLLLGNLFHIQFMGDVIVVAYLTLIPSLAVMLGGLSSGNPLAVTGARREMKLIIGYELPFIIVFVIAIIKNDYGIMISSFKGSFMPGSISGILSFIIALFCIQAKLGLPPFDIAEAETEIMEGPYIEYSGALFGVFKLTQSIGLFSLPLFLITLFLGGVGFSGIEILWSILKFLVILLLLIVIKNTNPRVRIDQSVKFFWFILTPIGIISLILAIAGRIYGIGWL